MEKWTTLKVTNEVRDAVKSHTEEGETYNDTLERILEGYVEFNKTIERPAVALTLYYTGYTLGEISEQNILNITFEDLKNSNVDDVFEAEQGHSEYYEKTSAKVIYKDEDAVFIKLSRKAHTDTGNIHEVDMITVRLIWKVNANGVVALSRNIMETKNTAVAIV